MDPLELADRVNRVSCIFRNAAVALYKGERQEFDLLYVAALLELDGVQDLKSSLSE